MKLHTKNIALDNNSKTFALAGAASPFVSILQALLPQVPSCNALFDERVCEIFRWNNDQSVA
jgi:hypothetical protein